MFGCNDCVFSSSSYLGPSSVSSVESVYIDSLQTLADVETFLEKKHSGLDSMLVDPLVTEANIVQQQKRKVRFHL